MKRTATTCLRVLGGRFTGRSTSLAVPRSGATTSSTPLSTSTTGIITFPYRPLTCAAPPGSSFASRPNSSSSPKKPRRRRAEPRRTTGIITVERHRGKASAYCYGCGAELVRSYDGIGRSSNSLNGGDDRRKTATGSNTTVVTARPGEKDSYWRRHRRDMHKADLSNWALCDRCRSLRQAAAAAQQQQPPKQQQHANDDNTAAAVVDDLTALAPDHAMTQVFRQQVRQIRWKRDAVVVLCVDASNFAGTFLRTLRQYVGGHPVLLAVTRCDLLPPHLLPNTMKTATKRETNRDDEDEEDERLIQHLKQYYAARARELQPAAVYLCSCSPTDNEEDKHSNDDDNETAVFQKRLRSRLGGLRQLASDLWRHRRGRDPYIVGAANIGKSTLTDCLIAGFLHRGERLGHADGDRLARRRWNRLRSARVTKSALAGTTLQSIRVPCFRDHTQALWDTPGLVLDDAAALFPVRRQQRRQQLQPQTSLPPPQIVPQIHRVQQHNSFCLMVTERDDPAWPLLRVEVRLKKVQEEHNIGPVQLVWNSTLNRDALETRIAPSLPQARREEQERAARERRNRAEREQEREAQRRALLDKSPAERQAHGQIQRRQQEEREQQLLQELGPGEYERYLKRQAAERAAAAFEVRRQSRLAELLQVHEMVQEGGVGVDLAVANFGWLGVLLPRTALVRTFAPHVGVRVQRYPTLGLPPSFGPYERLVEDYESDNVLEETEEWDEELMLEEELNEYRRNQHVRPYHGDDHDCDWGDDDDYYENTEEGLRASYDEIRQTRQKHGDDPWAPYSGERIGWKWDDDAPLDQQEWKPMF